MTDWLRARALATPRETFLRLAESAWSFAEIDRLATSYSALLAQRGIEPGDRAAILMPNGLGWVVTLLALMRLRAIAVPLNLRLTATELAWQLRNVECRMLIRAPELRVAAAKIEIDTLVLPPTAEAIDRHRDRGANAVDLGADFAIAHTSGTSGRPKAAVLTYGNVFHGAMASAFRLGLLPADRWLCILPLYHIGGLSIVLRSLLYGTAVELMASPRFDAAAVNRLLAEKPISLVSLVPTMLQRLLDAKTRPWHPRLRLILLGGEAPSAELLARCLAEELPIATSYGLTEAASQVATAMPDLVYRKPGSVGKPLMFTQTRIVGDDGAEAAANQPGEVLVKGPSVMRAYHNDGSASEEALQNGWLRAGDIGYRDEDGDLFILQRRADLIVSGGENIYPAEVERVLRQHPAVNEAVVFGLPDRDWGQRVAAIIECQPVASVAATEVAEFARQSLAGYKIPRRIIAVSALPRTASGKISRQEARRAFDDAISRET